MSGISFVSKSVMLPGEENTVDEERDRPDEKYDARPLWEKLAENKRKAEEEEDERMKFSNQIKVMEEDDVAFLASVNDAERKRQKEIEEETKRALAEFREAGASRQLQTATKAPDVAAAIAPARTARPTDHQKDLLSSLVQVKKKRKTDDDVAEVSASKGNASAAAKDQTGEKPPSGSAVPAKAGTANGGDGGHALKQLLGAYGDDDESGSSGEE
ncbi:hypothetical protein DFJ74DRAFT_507742 [Hyaloraphidium curvatum]|nr:hypothetical protein DFJ74DRAFT_507742 [Hyaloraphidium curvatum]